MKFTISQKELADTLAVVSYAVPNKPHHPILNNILLVADQQEQQILVTAFDLSLGIRVQCKSRIELEGKIALPAKLFTQVISSLPKQDITLEIVDNAAIITHSCGKCRIQTVSPQEFPSLPEIEGKNITLPAIKLLQALEATLFAASNDENKQVLAGVHFQFTNSSWEAAATDGHRLAVVSGIIETDEQLTETTQGNVDSNTVEITIPQPTLIELQKILGTVGDNSECTISIDNSIAVFTLPTIQITTRLLEGDYPKYSALIPRQFQHQVIVDRKLLDHALKRVGIVADQKNKIVKIICDYQHQQVTLSTESSDIAGAVESLNIKPQDDYQQQLVMGFNIKYLEQALKFIPTNEVLIHINQTTTPVVITPVDGILNQLILVMPVQLINNNSTAMKEDAANDNEEVVATEHISSTNEVNEKINVAAEAVETEEDVKDKNNVMKSDSSLQKNTAETKTNSRNSANSTPKPRGRKKKVAAA
ncbi:DNA polymerase III subunit beta [Sphaerospermopsis kisseleviana CS-549]|uniref:DNA polymerase III subunit beta n=1 Tax=Sphaerospermopsis kisseleviana CS-549 TaxID=3021783 RepID=A0ABT4ZR06_9CYAN|nr:DNA polymerase III subunit beta [Sphaerospermopsis kisseleviana]MDB9441480.1 DNA polymerase III subunit beta [Sphaerospermopsis kisseleviana CS-549]BAZ83748.1 DNA polymerase III beta subunit [Sphaerospermopsis kisseleviana NIES-73]